MKKMNKFSRVAIAIASLALAATYFLPVWFIFLIAPQYPEGLTMNIWLNKITGQVDIINGLNHYIGMKHIKAEMFPEFTYLIYIIAFFIIAGLTVAMIGKRSLLLIYNSLLLLFAIAAMYDFYKWGYDYGHNLDPKAAIQVPGLYYQPPLVGHKTLLNFDAYSYPDSGGWVVIIAALVFFGVWFFEWWRSRKKSSFSNRHYNQAIPAIAAVFLLVLSSCNTRPEPFAYGKDVCDDCRMTIVDPKFGAEIVTKKGRIYKFDDVHCLLHFLDAGKADVKQVAQLVFADYRNKNLIDANAVYFVKSAQLRSPMNSNTAAFSDKTTADHIAFESSGDVMTWNEVAGNKYAVKK
jgi:copper chaperone NosL